MNPLESNNKLVTLSFLVCLSPPLLKLIHALACKMWMPPDHQDMMPPRYLYLNLPTHVLCVTGRHHSKPSQPCLLDFPHSV